MKYTREERAKNNFLWAVLVHVNYLNNSLNFVLYILIAPSFRKQFIKLFIKLRSDFSKRWTSSVAPVSSQQSVPAANSVEQNVQPPNPPVDRTTRPKVPPMGKGIRPSVASVNPNIPILDTHNGANLAPNSVSRQVLSHRLAS